MTILDVNRSNSPDIQQCSTYIKRPKPNFTLLTDNNFKIEGHKKI